MIRADCLSKPESPLFSIADGVNVIYMNTFSRTIAPSVRIGYMILPETLVDAFEHKLGFYSRPRRCLSSMCCPSFCGAETMNGILTASAASAGGSWVICETLQQCR